MSNPIFSISPLSASPRLGLIPIPNMTVSALIASTGSGVITLTPAELLGGLINVDCQDAQSANLPDAAVLIAAIPAASGSAQFTGAVGFRFTIRNIGDSLLTLVAGAGCTIVGTGTVVTVEAHDFIVVITDTTPTSPTYSIYSGPRGTY